VKLKITQDILSDLVTRGASSAAKNSPSHIVNNARLVADGGNLFIASTDFDMMVEASGPADIEREGATTVDAAKLKMVVERLPRGKEIKIELNDEKAELIVQCGRSRTVFPTLTADLFPARDASKVNGAEFELAGSDLVKLFGHTAQSLSSVGMSPMAGVFLHMIEGESRPLLAAVGTSGHFLFRATVGMPEGAENMPLSGTVPGVILSAETVAAILRNFRSAEVVNIRVDSSTIVFTTANVLFCSSMLVGTYPPYVPLVSNPSKTRVLFDRASAANTVALLETFASKELGHRLQCGHSDEGLVVAVGGQTGNGVDVIEAEIDGKVETFGINGQYLKMMLASFKSSAIVLHPDPADMRNRRIMFLAEDEPDVVGVIATMNITTEMVETPKHG
jgi:DNA polymerase III subunit beta